MNYKNNKPKAYKGCCAMCACQDHEGGLRNKRSLTLAEERVAITFVEGVEAWLHESNDPGDDCSPWDLCEWCDRMEREYELDEVLAGQVFVGSEVRPLRVPLGALVALPRAA